MTNFDVKLKYFYYRVKVRFMNKFVKNVKIWYYTFGSGVRYMVFTTNMLEKYCIDNKVNIADKTTLSDLISAYFSLKKVKKVAKSIDFSKYITSNKSIMNGLPVIKGTRITVKTIYESSILHASECIKNNIDPIELIKKDYPSLSDDEILFALLYYMKNTSFLKLLSDENINR